MSIDSNPSTRVGPFEIIDDAMLSYHGHDEDVVVIPEGIKVIAKKAFFEHTEIKKVILPEGLEYINALAFWGCYHLEEIEFPSSLLNIGLGAFAHTGLKEVAFPKKMRSTGADAFSECLNLKEVHLHLHMESIANGSFKGCTSLKEIEIPESVTYIGAEAFRYCENLETINLPENLEYLSDYAFSDCPKLSCPIVLPKKVSMGIAFQNCPGLREIYVPSDFFFLGTGTFTGLSPECVIHIAERSLPESWPSGCFGGHKNIVFDGD